MDRFPTFDRLDHGELFHIMYIFSQKYRKQVKQKLVNTLYNYYKQYNNNRYSDELV